MCGHGHPGADQHCPPVLQQGNRVALWIYWDFNGNEDEVTHGKHAGEEGKL